MTFNYLRETVINIVRELTNNAVKANLKRIYFKNRNLDITETGDYREGMEHFKDETYMSGGGPATGILMDSEMLVRVSFTTTDDHIQISVTNNVPILDVELKKITSRIEKAGRYRDIAQAFDEVLDDSEGAGLGLIMAVMLLRNCGLDPDTLTIHRRGELTIARLSIPKKITNNESRIKIADEILKEVDNIPSIPENIRTIQRLCNNPESTIKEISDCISRDPGITASILKLANSAGYITSKNIVSIEEGVKIIGIKGLNNMILASEVHRIMESRYSQFERIWKESYKRAFYSQKISIQMKQSRISDFSYLAGLLADIGYIIMLTLKEDLLKKLHEIAGNRGIENSILLEEISLGVSHSSLGAMICRKWRFNEALTKTIEYHHRPYMAPDNYRKLIYIVYLATAYIDIENYKLRYEIIDEDVLDYFNIGNKEEFEKIHEILIESYGRQEN